MNNVEYIAYSPNSLLPVGFPAGWSRRQKIRVTHQAMNNCGTPRRVAGGKLGLRRRRYVHQQFLFWKDADIILDDGRIWSNVLKRFLYFMNCIRCGDRVEVDTPVLPSSACLCDDCYYSSLRDKLAGACSTKFPRSV